MTEIDVFVDYKRPSSDFIVSCLNDLEEPRDEQFYMFNLKHLRSKLIKGFLSTEGNLASEDDIDLLTTSSFSSLSFSRNLREKDILDVWAMDKAMKYLEENFYKPIDRKLIEGYNELLVTGYKFKYSGEVRRTNVHIQGSTYAPPDFQLLDRLFDNLINEVNLVEGEVNKAFSLILGVSKLQLFIDGNKRTAFVVALHHLCNKGQKILLMDDSFSTDYLKELKVFYETGDNSSVVKVLERQLV